MKKLSTLIIRLSASVGLISFLNSPLVLAASDSSHDDSHAVQHFGKVFLMLAIVLMAGKIGNVVEKYGQPAVVGELLAGITLSALAYYGLDFIEEIRAERIIAFVSSFGALILLFLIGLESNIKEMAKVGPNAAMVAVVGVVLPFVSGAYVLGPLFYGDESSNARLFLGAAMVATSVGITASVFKSLGISKKRAAQTVLGAAVIDDVLGLIILSVVSALAAGGEASVGLVAEKAALSFGFLAGAIVLGQVLTKPISQAFSKIHTGVGMKLAVAISFALVFGYIAEQFGLEAIIGAFAAGLLLDAVVFDGYADPEVVSDLRAIEYKDKKTKEQVMRVVRKHSHSHIEDLINNIGMIFIPVFFVVTGLQIEFSSLLEPELYLIAGAISVVAIATKLVAGLAAKGDIKEKLLVGASMVPRGEVGLIFAATGKGLGVLSDELFSVIVLVVVITTFIAPAAIKKLAAGVKA